PPPLSTAPHPTLFRSSTSFARRSRRPATGTPPASLGTRQLHSRRRGGGGNTRAGAWPHTGHFAPADAASRVSPAPPYRVFARSKDRKSTRLNSSHQII